MGHIVAVVRGDLDTKLWERPRSVVERFADIGGLDKQIEEFKEVVELPLTQPLQTLILNPQKEYYFLGSQEQEKHCLARSNSLSLSLYMYTHIWLFRFHSTVFSNLHLICVFEIKKNM